MRTTSYFSYRSLAQWIAVLVVCGGLAVSSWHVGYAQVSALNAGRIFGWVWSGNVGWIHLGGTGTSNYGVYISPSDGVSLAGYGWSNVGWISFNQADTSICGTLRARVVGTKPNVSLEGWARVLNGVAGSEWDGCIKLREASAYGAGYGPHMTGTYAQTGQGGALAGYAWGSGVVGWIQFDSSSNNKVYLRFTACNNGLDDDGDGNTDLADDACTSRTIDSEAGATAAGVVDIKANGKDSGVIISKGSNISLTWSSADVGGCTLTTPSGTNAVAIVGSLVYTPVDKSTFTFTCHDLVGGQPTGTDRSDSVQVSLTPTFKEI